MKEVYMHGILFASMKIAIAIILLIILGLICMQVWSFYGKERALANQLTDVR